MCLTDLCPTNKFLHQGRPQKHREWPSVGHMMLDNKEFRLMARVGKNIIRRVHTIWGRAGHLGS